MTPTSPQQRIHRLTALTLASWSLVIAVSAGWNIQREDDEMLSLARAEAKASLDRDLAFRAWASDTGGLYVPVDEKVKPNPYLSHIANRDLPTHDGTLLTLINPATIVREMSERYAGVYGVKVRITGLKLLNPINAPDKWEIAAMNAFAGGKTEASAVVEVDGQPHLRLMRPMMMEASCLKCHAWTGIQVGQIRGATGVAIPLSKYYAIKSDSIREIVATHGVIWLIGVGMVGFVSLRSKRLARDKEMTDHQLRKLSHAVDQSANGILITNTAGVIEYVNPKFCEINGYSAAELIGNKPSLLKSGQTAPEIYRDMWQSMAAGKEWRGELKNRRKSGESYWCLETLTSVRNDSGEITHYMAVTEDINERKFAEETIRNLAYFDPLTNLANRRLLRDRMTQGIAWCHRDGNALALLYLDLDRFKTVNDSLGHPVGDELLKQFAARVSALIREGDTVARLGGDEFAILLHNVQHGEDVVPVAEKIIGVLSTPFQIGDHELFITTSIGISLYPHDASDIDELLRNADIALYQAKNLGKNNFQFYAESINVSTLERLNLENGLRRAVERNELFLEYQPQINLRSGKITGAEALIRWQHPELGRIPPLHFIPLAEETRLIVPIGEWVLRTACEQLKKWRAQGMAELTVAVNLSAIQFRQKGLLDKVRSILDETGTPPGSLELELTESALMDNPQEAIKMLAALRQLDIKISIDDFGTGYSSLGYLKRFPVNVLKIDRSFICDITVNQDDRAIAEAIIALARGLNLWVVAEGVETAEQLDILRAMNADSAQGYYFSKPVPAEDFPALVNQITAR